MARNERQTCTDPIEPALEQAGWSWQAQLRVGNGRVNLSGAKMHDETQSVIADGALSAKQLGTLQTKTFFGLELKPLTYLLRSMNMTLHGIEGATWQRCFADPFSAKLLQEVCDRGR